MSNTNEPLPTIIVTEIITQVRVWRVPAVDVRDAVNRVVDRAHSDKEIVCVSNHKETRWAGAPAVPDKHEVPVRAGRAHWK